MPVYTPALFFLNPITPFIGLCAIGLLEQHLNRLVPCSSFKIIAQHVILFFIFFFSISMYWVALPFTTIQKGYLGPLGVIGIAIILTTLRFPLILLYFAKTRSVMERRVAFIMLFFMGELSQSYLFTGLPWNLAAHALSMQSLSALEWGIPWADLGLSLMQISHLINVYGLSLIIIFVATMIISPFFSIQRIIALLTLLGLFGYGTWHLQTHPTTYATHAPIVRLVQPCIDPNQKWSLNFFHHVIQTQMELSLGNNTTATTPHDNLAAIIWPESAIPTSINLAPQLRSEIAKIIPRHGYLLAGAIQSDQNKHYTTIVALNALGDSKATHRKVHLLPFGEYIPFYDTLHDLGLSKFTPGDSNYTKGEKLLTMHLPNGLSLSPLICCEALFAGQVIEKNNHSSSKGPQWLLNITNDAWFGKGTQLWQHLANVRFRAIEEKIPLIRVANTGITAIFDRCGRLLHHTKINEPAVIDVKIPS